MSITSTAPAGTLLGYAVTSGPEQLQVSPPDGNPSYGAVTIVVSNPSTTTPVVVQEIQFSIRVGQNATDLTGAAAASGILVTASPPTKWKIAQTAAGVFTAAPAGGQATITGTGLAFRLSNIVVNQQVGTSVLAVRETSAAAPDGKPGTPAVSTTTLPLPKFPYGFFVSDLTAGAPRVANGDTVTLTWAGSDGPTYTILFGEESADVSTVRSWTSPPLVKDTTFFLKATAQAQAETVTRTLEVTVTVADPSLTARDLTVLTDATVIGTAQVGPTPEQGTLGVLTVNATNPVNQAISATSVSPTAACAFFRNATAPLTRGLVSGVGVIVASPSAIGLWTNGVIASAGSIAAIAHLPTADGIRAVTSPLSLEPEIHLSGTARLSEGTATVSLDPDAAGMVFHGDETPYRVLLTPTGQCNGLAVTRKDADGFVVTELAGGRGDATFDWFLVAHRRSALDAPDRAVLPDIRPPA